MSNFTLILADRLRRNRIERWITERSPAGEIERRDLAFGWRFFVVAADVHTHVISNTFYRGTVIAPEHSAIVLDAQGWMNSPTQLRADAAGLGGEFIAADWDARSVRVRRDVFSGVLLAHSQAQGVLMASDSLLVLADLRRHLGVSVTPNMEVLAARTVRSGHASQQMSPETQVQEISVVPVGRELVMHSGVAGRMEVRGPLLVERLFAPAGGYAERVRTLVAQVAGVVRAVGPASAGLGALGLSGGYDSRLVLAAARRTGVLGDFRVTSTNTVPSHASDFAVAGELAERFGFELNPSTTEREMMSLPGSPLAVWASTHLGVYDRLVPAQPMRLAGSPVTLSGIGAEILKGNWGWQSIASMVDGFKVTNVQRDALLGQVGKTLASVGADPVWPDASEFYYLGHRNGLHGTAHISTNMSQVRPLQLLPMAALGHSRVDGAPRDRSAGEHLVGSYEAIADMLALLDPEVASHRYDRPEKELTAASISERLERLGGPLAMSEVPDVRVFGNMPKSPAGASQLGVRVAIARGLDSLMEADSLMALGESWVGSAPPDVEDLYAHMLEVARYAMVKKGLPPSNSGAGMPKVLSLALLS